MKTKEKPRPAPPRSAVLVAAACLLLLYLPLMTLVLYSFLAPSAGPASPLVFSLSSYRRVFASPMLIEATLLSTWIALLTALVATTIGTMAALAIERFEFPGRSVLSALTLLPLMLPELVLGLSLLIWFVLVRMSLGWLSISLAHITFAVSYVVITVRARLRDFDGSVEEAAADLGANAWQTFWQITLPLIWPGVLSGALMAFTLSFDDFLITFFTAGVGSDTLPLKLYAMIKFGIGREVYALSTLIVVATLAVLLLTLRPGSKSGTVPGAA